MVTAAVLAGGSGSRMGAKLPKQFLDIGGVPVIVRTVSRFLDSGLTDKIITAVPGDYVEYTAGLFEKYFPGRSDIEVISGGGSRSDTLMRVLERLNAEGISQDDIILTHDAVRPFIDNRIIAENIEAAKKYGACNTCIPAVDTVFLSADGSFIDSVPPRSTVFHAQTPQSFLTARLYELCKGIPENIFNELTDGCSVFTYYGEKVFMAEGSTKNMKITYPEDIKKAELFLKDE